jgi:DNA-binding NtrC family response regulator
MSPLNNIWVIDDDRSIRWVLERALKQADMVVTTFENAGGVLERLRTEKPNAIITDVRMPGVDGLQLMEQISALYPDLPVIIMTAHENRRICRGTGRNAGDYWQSSFHAGGVSCHWPPCPLQNHSTD